MHLETFVVGSIKTILLVDDHESILAIIERLLSRPGRRLLRAGSGVEALDLVRSEHPDVVVLDVCMPGMDGLEVCDAIRRDPDLGSTRIVLMSAILGSEGLDDEARELGADACLGKPVDPCLLRRDVERLLYA